MTSLRVLHLTDDFGVGGAESLLPVLGRSLREIGLEVCVAALFARPTSFLLGRLEAENLNPRVVNIQGLRPPDLARLNAFVLSWKPDILHTHLEYATILGSMAALYQSRPLIATLHGKNSLVGQSPASATREIIFRLLLGTAAARVIAVSRAAAEYYARRGVPRSKLRIVHNAIDPIPFQAQLSTAERRDLLGELAVSPSSRVLITVARLQPIKGVDTALRAMRLILQREPNAVLLIVGEGPQRTRLGSLVEELQLKDAVRFLGLRSDVARLLQLAEPLLLTSRSDPFPTVLLEACAAGVPTVAFRIDGIPEIVRHDVEGLLVPPADVEAFAAAVCQLLRDEERRRRLGAAARHGADSFTTRDWAHKLLTVYQEAIN